jgi:hypothetical protein
VKLKILISTALAAVLASVLLSACGGGGTSSSGPTNEVEATSAGARTESATEGGEAPPSEAESAVTGDIPDNQTFLVFHDAPAGYSIRYPEGWARKGSGNDVTFREKANVIHVAVHPGSAQAKPGEKVTVKRTSAADPVTGKRLPLTVDRYEFERGGKVAVVELSTPVGVDNVDAYRLISESFQWR